MGGSESQISSPICISALWAAGPDHPNRGGHGPGTSCSSAGAVAFWLVATDSDNDNLTYGITGSDAYFFSITPDTGEVKLASPLDYEVKSGGVGKAWREGVAGVALGAPSPGSMAGVSH